MAIKHGWLGIYCNWKIIEIHFFLSSKPCWITTHWTYCVIKARIYAGSFSGHKQPICFDDVNVGKLSTTSLRRHRKWWLWLRQLSPKWPNCSGWRIRAMYPEKSWKIPKWSNLRQRSKASNVWEDWLWVKHPDLLWCQLWIHKPLVCSKRIVFGWAENLTAATSADTAPFVSHDIPKSWKTCSKFFQHFGHWVIEEKMSTKPWFIHWKWSFLHTFPILTVRFPITLPHRGISWCFLA